MASRTGTAISPGDTFNSGLPDNSNKVLIETQEGPVKIDSSISEAEIKPVEKPKDITKIYKPKAFSPDKIITVRNGFQGKLVYKSRKTGERFVWDKFNDEQDMELSELKNARSSGKNYFINNWFLFEDPEIVEYLGMSQYYKFALNVSNFDAVFAKDTEEMIATISKISTGQKKSVAYRAKQLISAGVIDSNKKIIALEECLGVELIER